jgi:hypothetical protein
VEVSVIGARPVIRRLTAIDRLTGRVPPEDDRSGSFRREATTMQLACETHTPIRRPGHPRGVGSRRCGLLAVGLLALAGCSHDAPIGIVLPDDLWMAPPDLWQPDMAVPPDLVTPPDLYQPPPPQGVTINMVGTWRSCGNTFKFAADGTFTRLSVDLACLSNGHYTVKPGDLVDLVYDATMCAKKPDDVLGMRVVQPGGGMAWYHASFSHGVQNYSDDTAPHILWHMVASQVPGGKPLDQYVRIVGDPLVGFGTGCSWSAPGMCGFISCGGTVQQWLVMNKMLVAGISCTGYCTCGGSIVATVDGGKLDGKFFSENCNAVFMGPVTGETMVDE